MSVTNRQTSSNKYNFGVNPEDYIYEDDGCFVFDAVNNPQAVVHYVVVPKKRLRTLYDATVEDEKILGHLLLVAKDIAVSRGLHRTGYHVVVDEVHSVAALRAVHVFGRALQHMIWPTGPGARL